MPHVLCAASLADAVHTQLRVAEIECPDAELGREHWPDGAAAGGVVAHDKELEGGAGGPTALLQEHDAWGVGHVPRVGADLDDGAAVDGGLVGRLVFAGVVGVHGVGHVGGDEEGTREGLLVGCGLVALVVDGLVALLARAVAVAREH